MGLLDFISANTTDAGGDLTPELLERTMEQLAKPRPPCHHVISPRATPGSLTLCANCARLVRVPDNWSS
jgi:hypothetical protein